jgi:hypothetical protein
MRIRSATLEELQPKARERALSPRQRAALEREGKIRRALGRLKGSNDVVAIDLDATEKIPTMRAAVKKVISASRPGTNMAIRGTTIYVSAAKLPGGRGGRRPRSR